MKTLNDQDIEKITGELINTREMITEIDIAISRLKLTKDILIQNQIILESIINK